MADLTASSTTAVATTAPAGDPPGTTAPLLTEEMVASTRKIHDLSDKLVNVKLLVALTNKELYGRALLLFYYVFVQIESSLQARKDCEGLQGLHELLPSFTRADAIAKDLRYFLGPGWDKKYQPNAAVTTYVNRIKKVEKENPLLLVAYNFHMYSALLAGGQIIKKLVAKSFDLPSGEGLHAFDFNTKSRLALRNAMKEKINTIAIDVKTKELVLAESMRVFKMNNQLVRSLDGTLRQFILWVCKWVIALMLVYWTYHLLVKGT